jgi:adenylate cyclase
MNQEIERKFLVSGEFKALALRSARIMQAYLSSVPQRSVRIRIAGEVACLTIKGESDGAGVSRFEWEKEIALREAEELLQICEPGRIEKERFYVPVGKHVYEVDVFAGDNAGLIIAEIELSDEHETFEKPDWLGKEVTGDLRYYNAMLARKPYREWGNSD